MKELTTLTLLLLLPLSCVAQPKVYFTREISPEACKALGKKRVVSVAVKIRKDEKGGSNYLKYELVKME